jgi:acetyltransferase-like isoleucine patch superfamily enzyme
MLKSFIIYMIQFIKNRNTSFIPPRVELGKNVFIGNNVFFDQFAEGGLISVGDEATITAGVKIITHDASSNRRIGLVWASPIKIGKRAYIGVNSIILPGVTIGDDAIIGAGSVVTRDVQPGTIVAGNPAKPIGNTIELDNKRKELSKKSPYFNLESNSNDEFNRSKLIDEICISAKNNGGLFTGRNR